MAVIEGRRSRESEGVAGMVVKQTNIHDYFATARMREEIRRRKEAGLERELWTTDPVFQEWRFCNVHRENDKTTVWFRENVRSKLSCLAALKATVYFRWFNKIETGEIIKDQLLNDFDPIEVGRRLKGVSPVVTGAYIIKGPDGFSKMEGVLHCIEKAAPQLEKIFHQYLGEEVSLEAYWKDLKEIYYLGPFMSYEVVSDLRWTDVLENAWDINTWANAGPGCARGLGWVAHDSSALFNSNSPRDQKVMLEFMQELLRLSKDEEFWPQKWEPWEMREVEHWSCEYDKIRRARMGLKLKRRYS
jgi:hypothetical protein